jgi:diphthamide synthase subunit DPH2
MYINTTNYDAEVNSVENIQSFLKEKYKRKVSNTIYKHEFYYISESEECGPNTVEELTELVKNEEISAYCFVRDVNEDSYAKRLRIIDLMQEL